MPTVSVVIPSFRGGRFLREAVASVQSQTLTDWEIVIVLDGCEDDLSDIEQADSRVRVFQQRNRGVSIARNVGIEHAQSELVALLDDDDRMLPDRLLAQVEAMSDEIIGLCHTQFCYIDDEGAVTGAGLSKESQYRDFLRDDGEILLSSTMIRKSLIEEVGGFSPLLTLCEDLDLLYKIARESTVRFLPEVLTEYRRHSSNTSPTTAGGAERKMILREHLFAAEARGETENVQAIRQGMSFILAGRTEKAIRYAHEARTRHNYLGMLSALSLALLLSPGLTLRVSLRQTRRDRFGDQSFASFVRNRIRARRENGKHVERSND
jgi:glycosyltransferase involved in cell wall biosynthesis